MINNDKEANEKATEGETMKNEIEAAWINVEERKADRDKANTALREAWDIEDAHGINDASDREIERLRKAAERAQDKLDEAKQDAIATWKAAGSPWPLARKAEERPLD